MQCSPDGESRAAGATAQQQPQREEGQQQQAQQQPEQQSQQEQPQPQGCADSADASAAQLGALASSIAALDGTAQQLAELLVQRGTCSSSSDGTAADGAAAPAPCEQPAQPAAQAGGPGSAEVAELQQQLAALLAEKQRVEADRQEIALQQGKHKGTIAQLEGALAFSERKVKDQLAAIEKLQAQVTSLAADLQEARGAAAQTPDRCRTAARALQAEADRATTYARSNEAQVRKLKQIVQLEARQLSELLDFAEQERLTLLDKEAALQQELDQARSRAVAAEGSAADTMASAAALERQLEAAKDELLACQERMLQLEELLAEAHERQQAAAAHAAVLSAERDAAARNLLRAEAELNDVGEYSTKMFRQVRFISHMLDKHSAVLSKLPDFASLSRDLRTFVAANARSWEHHPQRDDGRAASAATGGAATGAATAAGGGPAASAADTAASGMRDVLGKA